jgi:hypothetical protein
MEQQYVKKKTTFFFVGIGSSSHPKLASSCHIERRKTWGKR